MYILRHILSLDFLVRVGFIVWVWAFVRRSCISGLELYLLPPWPRPKQPKPWKNRYPKKNHGKPPTMHPQPWKHPVPHPHAQSPRRQRSPTQQRGVRDNGRSSVSFVSVSARHRGDRSSGLYCVLYGRCVVRVVSGSAVFFGGM
ncbi:hypothetical protein P167DRAFT_321964 [Morchella conica CCBAS932]|uniref:Uncharacterized protein n=1 Tax=Morchella conica CCBAS932 TaxID=1392247 RepID=A0A3N4KF94_9PEZI|nr:hypothetical protein P167DRAFT_321964 [Morchella conica CCBAS932]